MSRMVHLIALALAAAAVGSSLAQAGTTPSTQPKVDPLAVGYLTGKGLSPGEVRAWTVGACSHESKPAWCYAALAGANPTTSRPKVDPLAVGYLMGKGLSPSEVAAWTVGTCSHESKPAVCYSILERTNAPVQVVESGGGFDWADAGIGAGAALGFGLLLTGFGAGLVISRQKRRQQAHGM
jgi:hypothetical protein